MCKGQGSESKLIKTFELFELCAGYSISNVHNYTYYTSISVIKLVLWLLIQQVDNIVLGCAQKKPSLTSPCSVVHAIA